jgi:hypothetical protein
MITEQETDPTEQQRFATSYVYATKKLHLSKQEAENFARTEMLRDRFFGEAFRLPHNLSLRLLYFIPTLLLLFLVIVGLMLKTNWWFYGPALVPLALWRNSRKWSSFWIPILYWFKPFVKEIKVAENDLNPGDWKSYYFLPHPHGRANVKMMINASYEEVCHFGPGVLVRSLFGTHGLFLSVFAILAYFAWR